MCPWKVIILLFTSVYLRLYLFVYRRIADTVMIFIYLIFDCYLSLYICSKYIYYFIGFFFVFFVVSIKYYNTCELFDYHSPGTHQVVTLAPTGINKYSPEFDPHSETTAMHRIDCDHSLQLSRSFYGWWDVHLTPNNTRPITYMARIFILW